MKLYRINALLLKYWYITINSMDRMFDVFYWPVINLIVFGFTTLYLEKAAKLPEIFVFFIGGVMLWIIFQRSQQDVSTYILEDFWSRNVANSFATPVKESEIFVASSIFAFIRAIISFLILFAIAFIAYKFNIISGGLPALIFTIPLFIFGWGLGILMSGLFFRFGARIQVFAWSITFLLQPLAAVYYPLETLPLLLQKIALFIPLPYVFEGFRLAYKGTFSYYYLFLAFGLALLYMLIGYLVFILSVKKAKKTGLLTQY